MSESIRKLERMDYLIICALSISILVIGLILLGAGLNEAFYVPNEGIRAVFSIITQLGDELIFIALIAFVYLGLDKVFGKDLLYGFMISSFVNTFAKVLIKDPRPPTNMGQEEGYGFPSGHTQFSVSYWAYSMFRYKDHEKSKLITIISSIVLVLVPISRMIIGVHDLEDVIGGYIIGFIILAGYSLVQDHLKGKINLGKVNAMFFGLCAWITLWVICIVAFPADAEEFGLPAGILIGVTIGIPLEETYVRYENRTLPIGKRIAMGILGVVFTLAIYFGLSLTLGEIASNQYAWRMVRYALLGFLTTYLVPIVLKLLSKKNISDKK